MPGSGTGLHGRASPIGGVPKWGSTTVQAPDCSRYQLDSHRTLQARVPQLLKGTGNAPPHGYRSMTANDAYALMSRLPEPAADPPSVLVVDDDSAVRTMVARALEISGYAVVVARDGAHALELLECRRAGINLVLTDIQMPTLGGLELGREVAARQWDIPVLYMSGNPPDAACLQKPFTISTLITSVRHLLAGSMRPEPETP
jgi:CheY-like chemotaxis protein